MGLGFIKRTSDRLSAVARAPRRSRRTRTGFSTRLFAITALSVAAMTQCDSSIQVSSDPSGARIYVGHDTGEFTGCHKPDPDEPCEIVEYNEFVRGFGLHTVTVRKPGYEDGISTFFLMAGETRRVHFDLIQTGPVGPDLEKETVVDGLTIPWDLEFAPDGTMIFNERSGNVYARRPDGTLNQISGPPAGLYAYSASGLLGLTLDRDFAANRTMYTCALYASGVIPDDGGEVRIDKWQIDADFTAAEIVEPGLVSGITPNNRGYHTGCRVKHLSDGNLWITTGDATLPHMPQDLTTRGGKVLRVDPATGEGAADNPFADSADANTRMIYTYGHRNPQGIAERESDGRVWSQEHGPHTDDEINLLVGGGNGGWDPSPAPGDTPGYKDDNPMTDLTKFPDAMIPVYATGSSTLALSGLDYVEGEAWGEWDGALVSAALKTTQLIMHSLDSDGQITGSAFGVLPDEGRLRTPVMGPDGSLYVLTSNSTAAEPGVDKIVKLTPADG